MILVIDNYDSFVHNLARYFRQIGCETKVCRNDEIKLEMIEKWNPDAIVISPGPCTPDEAGISLDVVRHFSGTHPILGICLGHQAIAQAMGGTIIRAHQPVHGRQSKVKHNGSAMFKDIPSSFLAGRYHSLVADVKALPAELKVTAKTDEGTIMAVQHRKLPVVGLQFHPESILTECGYQLLINFLKIARVKIPDPEFLSSQPKGSWGNIYRTGVQAILSPRLSKQELP